MQRFMGERLECRNISRNSLHRVLQSAWFGQLRRRNRKGARLTTSSALPPWQAPPLPASDTQPAAPASATAPGAQATGANSSTGASAAPPRPASGLDGAGSRLSP
jgi:hypothetical protein